MSPEVASLDLCRKLSMLLPDAKTEYVWVKIAELDEQWMVMRSNELKNPSWKICLAWQIHELLQELLLFDQITTMSWRDRDGFGCSAGLVNSGKTETADCLVDALIKLKIWQVENV